jgi:hypothetical protein
MTLQEYFWALPKPVLSADDIPKASSAPYNSHESCDSSRRTWETWSNDPIRAAALRAILSCQCRLEWQFFNWDVAPALAQTNLVRFLHSYLLQVEEVHYENIFSPLPILGAFSFGCPAIMISGGQFLAMANMFKRKSSNRGVPFNTMDPLVLRVVFCTQT